MRVRNRSERIDMVRHEPPTPATGGEKVAIPRIPIEARQTSRRVQRACQKCHERKCKCDGEKPRCGQCSDFNVDCIYPSSRREENKAAFERLQGQTERYEFLLKNIVDKVGSITGDIQHTLGVRYYP